MVVSKWLIWWALLGLPAVVLQAIEGPLRDTAMAPDPRDYWFAVQVPDQSLAITIADWCDPLTAMLGMGFVTLPLVYLVWSLFMWTYGVPKAAPEQTQGGEAR